MKKKLIFAVSIILCIFTLMFAEYRYIMKNITPELGDNGTVRLEIFGQVDEYYVEE